MSDTPKGILEQQRTKYVEDMAALQTNLEKQPGIVGKIFASIGQFFTGFLPHVGGAITGAIPAAFKALKASMDESFISMVQQDREALQRRIARSGMSKELGEYLSNILDDIGSAEPFLVILYTFLASMGEITGLMRAIGDDTNQAIMMRARNQLPDAASAIRAMFIDPSFEKKAREIMQRYGLSDERTDMMILAAHSQLDPGTIQTLFLRGDIDEAGAIAKLRSLGYTNARAAEYMKTWNVIPGPQDIMRFAVREAFDEGQVSALGLDEAFPPAVAEWAAKVGLKEPWPKMFWRAHWELPSPQMGYEMLHRGLITEDDLDSLLRALDYSPRWHAALKGISYNVVTRVDARRLYGMGIWDEEKLIDAYRKMGYAPQDAEDLADWTKVEYAQEDKEVSRSQIEKAYISGIIDHVEALGMLTRLGWSKERAEWLLDIADFTSAASERTAAVQLVKDMYLAGTMDDTEARERLAKEEIRADYIEVLIERWNATLITKRKLPSKTDLDKFLKNALIGEDEYRAELARLGYSREMAERYFRLNTAGKE